MFRPSSKLLFYYLFFAISMAAQKPAVAQLLDIFGDDEVLDSIGSAIGCDLSTRLRADLPVHPLYSFDGVQCNAVVPATTGNYYSDAACNNALAFRRTGQQQFCREALDKENLGQGNEDTGDSWTLTPGVTYDVGAVSIDSLQQPYRTAVTYKTVDTINGQCRLQMRIYKNDLRSGQPAQRVMIALHGGSWTSRGIWQLRY